LEIAVRAFVLERLKDGVCSSDGIADPVADHPRRHEPADIPAWYVRTS
jgi:hypothetical protein